MRQNWEKVKELASLGVTQSEISSAWNELDKQQLETNEGWKPRVNRGLTSLLSPKNDGIYQLLVSELWSQKIGKEFPTLLQEPFPSPNDYFDREVKRVYDFDAYWEKIPGRARYQYAFDYHKWRQDQRNFTGEKVEPP